jgi:hypothetical protein
MTVGEIGADLCVHPWRLLTKWNWKAALLSAALRGAIFFTTNLTVGIGAAWRALAVDAAFRIPTVGLYAAVVQSFVRAEPIWAAQVTVALLVPAVSHTVELIVHRMAGTPVLLASVSISIAVSVISSLFELFAMRRSVLLVGHDGASFRDDLRQLPRVAGAFLMVVPHMLSHIARARRARR